MRTLRKTLGLISAAILSVLVLSCQKDNYAAPGTQIDLQPSEVTSVQTYSGEEFAALFEGIEVKPDTKCAAVDYEVTVMNYQSIGANGQPITLSMKLAYPKGILTKYHDPSFIVLDNHPTICSDVECPSYNTPYALAKALEDALVVCPDYEGYGVSVANDHPYLCHEINARQSVDAVFAAINYINGKKGIKMAKKYHLENNGYSQGGGIALAVHKYIENNLSASDQAVLNLKKSLCGGGPYNPVATFNKYKEWDELVYPTVAAMQIIGFMAGFPELFEDFTLADFFTPEFYASDAINMIRSKQYTIEEINAYFTDTFGSAKCSDIFSPAMFDETSALSQAVMTCLQANDLTTGWKPNAKVTLFHSKGDDVVPMENAQIAYNALNNGNVDLDWALASPGHVNTGILYYIKYLNIVFLPGILNNLL